MSVLGDYPDWSPHVATASQVAATGVPLLTKSSRLYQQADPNLGTGVTHSTGNLAVAQIGYEVMITVAYTTAPTNPFIEVTLTWIDSTTGFTIAAETFYAAGASPNGSITTHARGPTRADTLNVSYTNVASAGLATIGLTVLNNSRVYPYDMVRWINSSLAGDTVAGFTLATLPNDNSVLGAVFNGTIIASGSSSWLLGPGYGGWVNLAVATTGAGPSSLTFSVYAVPSNKYVSSCYAFRFISADASWTQQFKAPCSPLRLEVANAATTAGNLFMMATVGEGA